ncbi:DUF6308 family protein [Streptomyces sp. NPDC057694]|uniref:DUF6308 family protein n=1 Tax=Streptomyces sp. NPDC057694 TaxID=3346216 RepID=UPI0036CE70CE
MNATPSAEQTTDRTTQTTLQQTSPRQTLPTPDEAACHLATRMRAVLNDPRALTDLRTYFGLEPVAAPFTGARFESLGSGTDTHQHANTITATDLIAVQTLSVTVPAPVALDLLEGTLGTRLSELLSHIPADTDMTDADAHHLEAGSPADHAWHLLRAQRGVNWVIAGKLLARKRPRLLPVYDNVVRCALGRPQSFWVALHGALQHGNHALHEEVLAVRQAAGVPQTVSVLRTCDVAVWMRHHTIHRSTHGCERNAERPIDHLDADVTAALRDGTAG